MNTVSLLLLLGCTAATAHAGEFTAKVIAVIDGDTVMAVRNNAPPFKVRLVDIDAPEKAQQDGLASKASLSELALEKNIEVNAQAIDSYGRLVAQLVVDGKSINEAQIRRGMAWKYSNFHSNKVYIALQIEAQQARCGLWAGTEIMEPAQWRKLHAAHILPIPPALSAVLPVSASAD